METYSSQSNAKRAARKMMLVGTAPVSADDFDVQPCDDGRFAIVWKNGEVSTIEDAAPVLEQAPEPEAEPEDKWPVGTRVVLKGAILGRIDADHLRVALDGAAETTIIVVTGNELTLETKPRQPRPKKTRVERSPTKAAQLDADAACGIMPAKPDITSHANHHYQKRFDKLAELAAADDWDTVRAYQCNGVNSYAKMVRHYRDRLVAAHDAQQAAHAA
jgi:hypothetical protein